MTLRFGITVIVFVTFAAVTIPTDSRKLSKEETDFFFTFGTSPADKNAQMAVDNYFEVMLKVACRAPAVSYEHPELERAQELAESFGLDAPLEYKKFRYGRTCAGTE
ncbi:MAG: hypothetical protein Q8Q92_02670 [bacterium]|nr:hypothetical protein [bacterium]